MYPITKYMPKNVICNAFRYIVLYSEYLDYFHIELHFIRLGMLTKQAYSGAFFCSNLLNVLGPSLPESALYYIICCRGTKTIGYVHAKDMTVRGIEQLCLFSFFIYSAVKSGKIDKP